MPAAELEVLFDALAVVVAFRGDSAGLGVRKGQFLVRHACPPVEAAGGGDLAAVVGDAAEQFLAQLLRRRRAFAGTGCGRAVDDRIEHPAAGGRTQRLRRLAERVDVSDGRGQPVLVDFGSHEAVRADADAVRLAGAERKGAAEVAEDDPLADPADVRGLDVVVGESVMVQAADGLDESRRKFDEALCCVRRRDVISELHHEEGAASAWRSARPSPRGACGRRSPSPCGAV